MSGTGIYRPAPTLHLTRPSDDTLRLQTENSLVELNGSSADLFEKNILPLLDGASAVDEVSQKVGLKNPDDLRALLDELKGAGILLENTGDSAFLDHAEMLGIDRSGIKERLKDLRVAIIGDGQLAQEIHQGLCDVPVGHVTMVSWSSENQGKDLSLEALISLAQDNEYLISTLGDAFPAIDYRVNRAVHETGTAALFCRVGLTKSTVGPLVFPSETACFTCWRMRSAACADDFERFMEFEESAADRDQPIAHPTAKIGFLAQIVAGTAITELLKSALALGEVSVTDRLLEYEPFKGGWQQHTLLRRPDCPDCSKKKFSFQIDQIL
ncbi:hypothetical protein ROA7450_03827 [Roseovarius albus]|uniref:THIF-type NAD/FAD binding fold domain-containing protein n=1 Tax=Roseovarius albus TaxID=1247867 RepID=A0A1X7A471_9RHOB|nr:TOMM precursor leader peptide-binding protein [Roseovarius albus]SLN70216.1 hypothetical protein ROA7450_03827 [Roseovarius albus]